MPQGWIAPEWIVRPEFAASDWPAGELRGKRLPLPLALRVMKAGNVVGFLTSITQTALAIEGGGADQLVPFGVIRAYAILEDLISGSVLG